jgi:glycosyltransferase involved in cell wall biosynthesis
MGCGRYVVVNGIQENIDVIGGAGLSFERNNSDDLARILTELLKDPERVRESGELAMQHVQHNYSWETVARLTEQLYDVLEYEG